jgi:predicted metal-binding transcription factor (methanogenesis marker protein 9)
MQIDWKKIWKSVSPENISRWLSALGGRRFWLSLGAGLCTTILAWYAKISPEVYRDVVLGTVGMYITGNTVQKVKQSSGETTVKVAEVTGEAPVTIDATGAPIKVELSTKGDKPIGY